MNEDVKDMQDDDNTQKPMNEISENSIFSKNFKALRASKGINKKKMAELLSISPTTVSAYEDGSKSPSLSTAASIARKCDVSLDWLCGISSAKPEKEGTYSEIIQCLLKISELSKTTATYKELATPKRSEVAEMIIYDHIIAHFVSEWAKVKDLFENGTIERNLYNPWIAQQLADYDCPIGELPSKLEPLLY